jgi:hypothetical protein
MQLTIFVFIFLLNVIGTISIKDDNILIRLEEDIRSTRKRCNMSNAFIADLVDTLLKNATLVIENANVLNDTPFNDSHMMNDMDRDNSDVKLNFISTNFKNPVKKVKDSIERAKDSVDSLEKSVAESLLSIENEAKNVLMRRQRDEIDIIRRAVDRIKMKKELNRQEVMDKMKLNTFQSRDRFPESIYNEDGWQRAGYIVEEKENTQDQCKRLLESIDLHRFELRPDTRRMDAQRTNTTIQLGASDWTVAKTILNESYLHDTDPIVDAITFFYCNLMVLSELADRISFIDARIQVTSESFDGLNELHETILQTYQEMKKSGVESAATLALKIGVLETETQMKRIKMAARNITKDIDISLSKEKMEKQIFVAEAELQSLNKVRVNEHTLERKHMLQKQHMEMVVDSTIETISTVNELMEINGAITR